MALSPDSTPPPPILRLLEAVEGERGDKHGPPVPHRADKPATDRAGVMGEHGQEQGQASPIPGDSRPSPLRSEPLVRASQRPRAEIRNPADWERFDDVSPETTPERELAARTMPKAPSIEAKISSRALSPASGTRAPLERSMFPSRRARPTWVVRTPTPPFARPLPLTPPITPAHGASLLSRGAGRFGRDIRDVSNGQRSVPRDDGSLAGDMDADGEVSEDEECGSQSGPNGIAAGVTERVSVEDAPLGTATWGSGILRAPVMDCLTRWTSPHFERDRNDAYNPDISDEDVEDMINGVPYSE